MARLYRLAVRNLAGHAERDLQLCCGDHGDLGGQSRLGPMTLLWSTYASASGGW